jgi:hypothetical protein
MRPSPSCKKTTRPVGLNDALRKSAGRSATITAASQKKAVKGARRCYIRLALSGRLSGLEFLLDRGNGIADLVDRGL